MQTLRLGTIACLHGNVKNTKKFADAFVKENVDAIALIGDISEDENQLKNFTFVLRTFAKTGKPIFVIPGSHEHHYEYYSAMKKFRKNKNIIDCSRTSKINFNGYNLVFLPGSDAITKNSGFKILGDRSTSIEFKKYVQENKDILHEKINAFYISDLKRLMDKNSILICHVPPKFSGRKSIDVAEFGTAKKNFIIDKKDKKSMKASKYGRIIQTNYIYTMEAAKPIHDAGYPMMLHKKNVGNEDLKKMIIKTRLRKFVCGHIHEAGGKAVTRNGKPVKEGKFSKELFYNCSPGKLGRAGIVEFRDDLARFRNVNI